MKKLTIGALAGTIAAIGLFSAAAAETAMQAAIAAGAKTLTGPEIAERLADKTVTFESNSTGARVLVYYDGTNGTRLRFPDGKLIEGFYATTVADNICIGAYGDRPMVVRCVHVLEIDGVMHKFELDGTLRGRIVESQNGNLT